jgi:hydroxyacyl-ACP dehydratase HTD2-like protein with hotdog domain
VSLKLSTVTLGDVIAERTFEPTNVSLFLYNAAIWNPHRIHYDESYTTQVEKHPGVVVDGPLQGDWLSQVAINWIGDDGQLLSLEYANRRAAYLGECLVSGGTVSAIDPSNNTVTLDLFIKNEQGEITTPGTAVVRLHH